jgi:pimeloyl-ACP methyl ester carboxylesterase
MRSAVFFAAVLAAVASVSFADDAVSATAPAPAAPRSRRGLAGDAVALKTVDGWNLLAVWGAAKPGLPTVVLLHGTGQRKEDWASFTRALTSRGIGWLAVDLRGHGESRTSPAGEVLTWNKLRSTRDANDFQDMTRDAEAAVSYLTGQGVLEETIGLMGAEVGGSIAIKYAAVHPKTPFVILLSPGLSWREVPIVNAIRAYKNRPILMIHSEADKRSAKETPLLFQFAKLSAGVDHAALIVVPEERGTRLLRANKGLTAQVLDWIINPVPPAPALSTSTASGVAADTTTPAAQSLSPGSAPVPTSEKKKSDMDSGGFPAVPADGDAR